MPLKTLNLETRIKALNTVLTKKKDRQTVTKALRAANGDMAAALSSLKGKLPKAALQKVALAHSLGFGRTITFPWLKPFPESRASRTCAT